MSKVGICPIFQRISNAVFIRGDIFDIQQKYLIIAVNVPSTIYPITGIRNSLAPFAVPFPTKLLKERQNGRWPLSICNGISRGKQVSIRVDNLRPGVDPSRVPHTFRRDKYGNTLSSIASRR